MLNKSSFTFRTNHRSFHFTLLMTLNFRMKQTAIEKCALELSNQGYQDLQNNYKHLKDIKINDHDKKT